MPAIRFGFSYKSGDCVVYRKTKHSTQPGPRAMRINPNPNGDEYTYLVDKFWVVQEILPNDKIVLCTRRGKKHQVSTGDPNLRKASLWERYWYRQRFDTVLEQVQEN